MIKPSKTKKVRASEAPKRWTEWLDLLADGNTRVVVEQDGVPVAAIVSKQDLQSLKLSDLHRTQLFETVQHMRAAFADVPDEELEREIDKALTEVREENRRRKADPTGA